MSFWQNLNKPIMVLAPMANVTDAAFRKIIAKYGKPDVIWTEFVSADGLVLGNKEILLRDLKFDESERPIVAQFFSGNPDHIYEAGKLAVELGFDGVDINMGCPDKSVMKQGGGAALIRNPERARQLIKSLRAGAEEKCKELGKPMIGISVKTRVGYSKIEINTWIPELLKPIDGKYLDALTVHARTMKEMSKVPARWEHIKEIVKIRDDLKAPTLILGNGDLRDVNDAHSRVKESGADGAMLGRAIFGNPFLFSDLQKKKRPAEAKGEGGPSVDIKLKVMLEHTKLFEEMLGDIKNFALMKKHYKAYVNGFPASRGKDGAKELRAKLMEAENAREVENILKQAGY